MKVSKNFSREEFACKCGCGFETVDVRLIQILEHVRAYFDSPITINSGCRCESHNKAIDGSKGSKHLFGLAADIVVKDFHAYEVFDFLDKEFPNMYGFGKYKGFTHVDSRRYPARWG